MRPLISGLKRQSALTLFALLLQSPLTLQATAYNEEDHRAQGLRSNLQEVINETNESIARVRRDIPAVIVIGPVGSGKSTLLNYLAGSELVAERSGFSWNLRVNNPLQRFRFSAGAQAGTHLPTSWYDEQAERPCVYWDCPGFSDNEGAKQEIVNAYSIHQLFNTARNTKIMLVISEDILTGARGNHFLNLLNRVTDTFPESDQLHSALSLMITKVTTNNLTINYLLSGIGHEFNRIHAANPGQLKPRARDLLRFLADNASTRIGVFPQPSAIGAFAPDTASILQAIRDAEYVENFRFKLVVPAEAQIFIDELARSFNGMITTHIQEQGERDIINYFLGKVDGHNRPIARLRGDIQEDLDHLKALKNLGSTRENAQQFVEGVRVFLNPNTHSYINHTVENLHFLNSLKPGIGFSVNDWFNAALRPIIRKVRCLAAIPEVLFDEPTGQLDIRGILLGTSDIQQVLAQLRQPVRAIDAYALNTLFIDADIVRPGTYVTMIAPTGKVIEHRIIDVSGRNGEDRIGVFQPGQDGLPGLPGGNGGHIYAKAHTIHNKENLTLNAAGGNGGRGQDGAAGQDGTNGQDADLTAFTNRTITGEIYSPSIEKQEGYQMRTETGYKLAGSQGTPGQDGQRGGAGGQGGHGGRIAVEQFDPVTNNFIREIVIAERGNEGEHGQAGTGGQGGEHGRSVQGTYYGNWRLLSFHGWRRVPQYEGWGVQPTYVNPEQPKAPDGQSPQDVNTQGQQPPAEPAELNIVTKYAKYEAYKVYYPQQIQYEPFMGSFEAPNAQAQ
jgi:energy-coupling factor transporter ATP-binding protein EcfA2